MKAVNSLRSTYLLSLACLYAAVVPAQITPNANTTPATIPSGNVATVPSPYSGSLKVNFIRTWEAIRPFTAEADVISGTRTKQEVHQSTEYFDGLGRSLQVVLKQATPLGKDLVTPIIYDEFGRETYKYLPYAQTVNNTDDGKFKSDPFNDQRTFLSSTAYNPGLQGEQVYYSRTVFETSPLHRTDTVYATGNSWGGSYLGVNHRLLTNAAIDSVRKWSIGNSHGDVPTSAGYYAANELYKTVTIDEHGKQVVEYTDKSNRVVLKKVQINSSPSDHHTGWLCTYRVYDQWGNVRFVIQPEGTDLLKARGWVFESTLRNSSPIANEQCFVYEYDNKRRVVIKKIPSAGETWLVYDARNRLVMSQDSVLRQQQKWQYTQYDSLNRPVCSGLWLHSSDRSYHQTQAAASVTYPTPSSNHEILLEIYYDNYTWVSAAGLSATFISTYASNTSYFLAADNTTFPFPQAVQETNLTSGLVTGKKIKVLGTSTYLYTVSFFDDRGRVIQTHSTNLSGGKDTITMQYGFTGQLLRMLHCHGKSGSNPQAYKALTKIDYDEGGRVTRISKKFGNSPETIIVENAYDELGQLQKKKLGNVRDGTNQNTYTAAFLDSLQYHYNIQGWLSGINCDFARGTSSNNYFGMQLAYDYGFSQSYVNGNIAGLRWRSKGDGEQRAYGFTYDNAARLLQSDFTQDRSGSWVNDSVDFTVKNITYDANGNILSMVHKGLKLGGSAVIDSLAYGYNTSSNLLSYVTDHTNDVNTRLGDFKESTNNTSQDYWYDGNGNLIKDNNKSIGSISYNHLNLPQIISVTGKGTITYTYDALGKKMQKQVVDSTTNPVSTVITSYIDDFVYVNDTLLHVEHEEGRVRPKRANYSDTMYYDYFLKDHLNNVRVVLTDELQQDVYPAATLEGNINTSADAIYVEKQYYTIDPLLVVDQSDATGISSYSNNNGNPPYNNNPNSNTTAASQKLYRLVGTQTSGAVGLGMAIKVMSGDKLDIFGKSYYFQNNTSGNNYSIPVIDILSGLLGSQTGAANGKGATASNLNSVPVIFDAIEDFLEDTDRGSGTTPKAYVNWILLDENFRYVDGSFSRVGSTNTVKDHYSDAQLQNIAVTKNGYLYVYCSNESPVNVYFDNIQVIHTRSSLLEEAHYYPFGLTMAAISSKAAGKMQNRIRYNSKELQSGEFADNSGIEWYDYGARMYDPQLGRWHAIDPLTEQMVEWSPFNFVFNNPIKLVDEDGMAPAYFGGGGGGGARPSGRNRYGANARYAQTRMVYQKLNTYVHRGSKHRVSAKVIPNQSSGSAATPAPIYEPFTPHSGEQWTAPTITRGNTRGIAATRGIEIVEQYRAHIEQVTVGVMGESNGLTFKETRPAIVEIIWNNKTAEKQFNQLQAMYDAKVQEIVADNPMPAAPGANASKEAYATFFDKVQSVRLSIMFKIAALGPSPRDQILDNITGSDDYKKAKSERKIFPTVGPTR